MTTPADLAARLREMSAEAHQFADNVSKEGDTAGSEKIRSSAMLFSDSAFMIEDQQAALKIRADWRKALQYAGIAGGVVLSIIVGVASSYSVRKALNPHGPTWTQIGTGSCSTLFLAGHECAYCEDDGMPSVNCNWKEKP